jgi:hypothetical protein
VVPGLGLRLTEKVGSGFCMTVCFLGYRPPGLFFFVLQVGLSRG